MTKEDDITTGKSIAILAYITAIGFILAIVMNTDRKNSFIAYHIRQSLGLILLFIVVWLVLIFLNFMISIPVLNWLLYAGVFVLWVLGLLSAIQGEKKPVPLLGEKFQLWFKGTE